MSAKLSSQVRNLIKTKVIGDLKLPPVGLGTWEAKEPAELENALNVALELGYRHIDTAPHYHNEFIIGKVVNQWLSSGKLKRSDLFITTKLPPWETHQTKVDYFIKKSLEQLGLNYVDLYLINSSKNWDIEQAHLWQKMEEQIYAGRTKYIGLSNYNEQQIENLLSKCKIKPSCNQIEAHLYFHQTNLIKYCQQHGLTVIATSPLRNPGFNEIMKNKGILQELQISILTHPLITSLAIKYGKTHGQIALRFLLQRGVAVIPKTVHPLRLEENLNVFDFEIEPKDMEKFRGLDNDHMGRLIDSSLINKNVFLKEAV